MSQITPAPAGVLVFCVDSVVFWNLGVVVPLDELDTHAAPTRGVLPGLVVDGVPAASLVFAEPNLVGALFPVTTYTHRLVVRSGRVVHDSVDLVTQ